MIRVSLLVVGLLAGCQTMEDDPCGASGYGALVDASLAAVTLPADLNLRVIAPGDVVTQDFVPERLNVEVDNVGVIQRLSCG